MKYLACALLALFNTAAAQQTERGSRDCNPLVGWERLADASKDGVAIFGELHGTQESPAAVAEFVCAVSHEPVLLAIELNSTRNTALQSAWEGDGSREDFASAVSVLFDGRRDGVGSEAMVAMMSRLHDLRRVGADIDVVAFNGVRDAEQQAKFAHLPAQEPHEAAQAENIALAASRREYSYVVVLVGSFHAQKAAVQMGTAHVEPMAMHLSRQMNIVSLRMAQSGGFAWVCSAVPGSQEAGAPEIECREFEVPPSSGVDTTPGINLESFGTDKYDGVYNVGPVRASPPAS